MNPNNNINSGTPAVSSLIGLADRCSGCMACVDACPVNAISISGKNGFVFPHVDATKCIGCGRCRSVCQFQNETQGGRKEFLPFSFQANGDIPFSSSSGGALYVLGKCFLRDNGVVYGCEFDKNLQARHIRVDRTEDLEKTRQSKYVQSSVLHIYPSVVFDLKEGKKVLFCGTPCEISGLVFFCQLEKIDSSRLYLASIACHGVPSSDVLSKFVKDCEKRFGSKVENVNFRAKKKGRSWDKQYVQLSFANGDKTEIRASQCDFTRCFRSDLALRESCFSCSAKRQFLGDILVGDFWGSPFSPNSFCSDAGVNIILAFSDKGQELVSRLRDSGTLAKEPSPNPVQWNQFLFSSPKKPQNHDLFLDYLSSHSLSDSLDRFLPKVHKHPLKALISSWLAPRPYSHSNIRLCIVTLDDLENYGNRLQNFALQHYLKQQWGVSSKTLWPNNITGIKSILKERARRLKHALFNYFPGPKFKKHSHYRSFARFNRLIRKERLMLYPKGKALLNRKYDFFLAGSDQVWTSNHAEVLSNNLLSFVLPYKRYSYAASFGSAQLKECDRTLIQSEIPLFSGLSVRENEAVNVLSSFYHQPVSVHIDPVFLVNKNDWSRLSYKYSSKKIRHLERSKYLLLYWLGSDQKRGQEIANEIAKRDGLEVIYIPLYSSDESTNPFSNVSPFEFVFLIEHATFVVTNSFHGTAFSIIFNKKFLSVPIKGSLASSADSRFLNLQKIFQLPLSCFDSASQDETAVDWNFVNNAIHQQQAKSDAYFDGMLKNAKHGK